MTVMFLVVTATRRADNPGKLISISQVDQNLVVFASQYGMNEILPSYTEDIFH